MSTFLVETGLTGAIGTGIVFVEAGLAKLRHRDLVPGVVANYRLLPQAMVAPVAFALPVVEMVLGLGLIGSVFTGGALRVLGIPAAGLGCRRWWGCKRCFQGHWGRSPPHTP